MREKHGMCGSRLHRIWSGMKARCYIPSATGYEYYGGRGITVCDEWLNSFCTFYDWAVSHGYRDDLTLDRRDGDGPYAPWNCRWATRQEQNNNTQHNRYLELDGERRTLTEWASLLGMTTQSLWCRLYRGWSLEEALSIPKGGCRNGRP